MRDTSHIRVIHIFGASGSGTTTLARAITECFGYVHMDTDDYFWMPTDPMFTQKRDKAERLRLMTSDIERYGSVVISGSLCDWGDALIPFFDLAIRVETDTPTRLARLRAREYRRFGDRIREGGDMFHEHEAFLEWAAKYDVAPPTMRSRAKHNLWQKSLSCPLLTVSGTAPLHETLAMLTKLLA
ncbi:MAG: shikimate kinase [Clostridia bacterium]|nr:shikimate kinase [Clostridia bacterium]